MLTQRYITILVILFVFCGPLWAAEYDSPYRVQFNSSLKGIYVSQDTVEDREYLEYLIRRSKAVGITTFIIDLHNMSNAYERNILLVKNAGIKYIARIVVFPYGSDHNKINPEVYLMSRYRLVESAISLGAAEIQLDYIGHAATKSASNQNTYDVYNNVENWFRDKIDNRAKLQIDIFAASNINQYRQSEQIKAVEVAQEDGWYAWNDNNKYDGLFNALSQ